MSLKEAFYAHDPSTTDAERIQRITEQKYSKTDIDKLYEEMTNLDDNQKDGIKNLLHKYEELFDGTLGTWHTTPINLELKPDATPYHAKPYPVPYSQEETLREEVKRLELFGDLKKKNPLNGQHPCLWVQNQMAHSDYLLISEN